MRDAWSDDSGNAVVEFLGVALLLLVPIVYLVLVLGTLQAAAFAVDGAAREAARVFVLGDDAPSAARNGIAAAGLALADQGLDPEAAAEGVTFACSSTRCLVPGETVSATVEVGVPLPGVPGWLQDVVPLSVPVSSTATAAVDTFVEKG